MEETTLESTGKISYVSTSEDTEQQHPEGTSTKVDNDFDSDWEECTISERLEQFRNPEEDFEDKAKALGAYLAAIVSSESEDQSPESPQQHNVVTAEIHPAELNEERKKKLRKYARFKKFVESGFQVKISEEPGIEARDSGEPDFSSVAGHLTVSYKPTCENEPKGESSAKAKRGTVDDREIHFLQYMNQIEQRGGDATSFPANDDPEFCVSVYENYVDINEICDNVRKKSVTKKLQVEYYDFGPVQRSHKKPKFPFGYVDVYLRKRKRKEEDKFLREWEKEDIIERFAYDQREIVIRSIIDMIVHFMGCSRITMTPEELARQMNAKILLRKSLSFHTDRKYHFRRLKRARIRFEEQFEKVLIKSKENLGSYAGFSVAESNAVSDSASIIANEPLRQVNKNRKKFAKGSAKLFFSTTKTLSVSTLEFYEFIYKKRCSNAYLYSFLTKPIRNLCKLTPEPKKEEKNAKDNEINEGTADNGSCEVMYIDF